jgi:hypothetical protein
MQNKIRKLKQKLEENQKALYQKYGENCQLLEPTLNMLNLLITYNATDKTIEGYLNSMESSLRIIEEKIERISRFKT